MTHTKRQATSKKWPILRKGTKYIVTTRGSKEKEIPLLLVMREMLKLGKTRGEVKKILNQDKVLINNKCEKDEKKGLAIFDTISIKDLGKYYRLVLSTNRKFSLEEINEKEAKEKICKITGKRKVKGGKMQINLYDGRNILSDEKVKTGDSLVWDFEENKIKKVIPFEEKREILVISGKHIGKTGKIEEIKDKSIKVKIGEEKFEIKEENLILIN